MSWIVVSWDIMFLIWSDLVWPTRAQLLPWHAPRPCSLFGENKRMVLLVLHKKLHFKSKLF